MAQWMQCTPQWSQHAPTWADSVCSITTVTGGYPTPVFPDNPEQERERRRAWDEEKVSRDALRRLVRRALGLQTDAPPLPAEVAADVREAAEPFFERQGETGLRFDWNALEAARGALATLELLVLAERERMRRQREAEDDDDEIILMAGLQ